MNGALTQLLGLPSNWFEKAFGIYERPSNAGRSLNPTVIEFFLDQVRTTKEKAERLIRVDLPKKICSLNEYLEVHDVAFLILERSKRVPEEFGRSQSGCHNRRGWVQQGACFLPFSFEGDYEAQCVAKTGDDWLPCHLWCASVLLLEVIPRRMWITYNRAPYDNGHPIGEEVQVVVFYRV